MVAILAGLLVLAPGLEGVLPQLDALWLSRGAAKLVAAERRPGERIGSAGYTEASLVFLLGTDTALVSPETLQRRIWPITVSAWRLVEGRDESAFQAALTAQGLVAHAHGQVQGLDYSNGKRMVLTLYRAEKF